MQLTQHTDYGFRLLTYLALLPEGEWTSIDKISRLYNMSRNSVNKIVHQLSKEGVIDTKQGKGGGFCLKMLPQDINVGNMVLILENNIRMANCQSPPCRIYRGCALKDVFQEATQAFLTVLNRYTLADLLKPNHKELAQALSL